MIPLKARDNLFPQNDLYEGQQFIHCCVLIIRFYGSNTRRAMTLLINGTVAVFSPEIYSIKFLSDSNEKQKEGTRENIRIKQMETIVVFSLVNQTNSC